MTRPAHVPSRSSLIGRKIHLLRDQRIMLDADLAELYGVDTRTLVQAVKRNTVRFPGDFIFPLCSAEFVNLRSQIVISSWGGWRTAPYAFTKQGVAMLSSVLSSAQAIAINIEIMRTFVMVRQLAATHQDLAKRLDELEVRTEHQALKNDASAARMRTSACASRHRHGWSRTSAIWSRN